VAHEIDTEVKAIYVMSSGEIGTGARAVANGSFGRRGAYHR